MIDLHSHILPGVDDGAGDLQASLAMARVAVDNGIQTMVATPHLNSRYRVEPNGVSRAVGILNLELAREGIPLAVLSGVEIAFSQLPGVDTATLRRLTLGGGGCLLVECPYRSGGERIEDMLFDLELRGLRALLAHPERSPSFQRQHARLERLVQRGVMCVVNAGSVAGRFGGPAQRAAFDLLGAGLVHAIASDAHDPQHRAPSLTEPLLSARRSLPGIEAHVGWLTQDAPAAILAGSGLPPRPAPLPRARGGLLGRLAHVARRSPH
jgi:protein-tyrosine phosphatase